MRWFVRGDVDGFFGLALDNLVQLLLIDALCRLLLGFDGSLIYGRMLPAIAVSLLVGNLFYAWQAKRLADRTGRTDVCALPYGINTVSLLAYVFLVMLPAKGDALNSGATPQQAALVAWQAGLVACLGCGVIELVGALVAQPFRRITPRAALLSTLAGIALSFIAMTFVFRTFARPVIGLTTLGIILLTYFGAVRFRGGVPGGLVAVAIGTALAWLTGVAPTPGIELLAPAWHPPVFVLDDLWQGLQDGHFAKYFAVILPMGLFNLLGSLQNIESAEAAGDSYSTVSALAVNGLGSVAAAAFGSCFPTTIYIGHPGWKALGARAGYSVLNALFFTGVCLTGVLGYIAWAVPVDAGMAIVLYIGIIITAQAFQATPKTHAPAVVLGLLPGIAAWGTLTAKQALMAVGYGAPGGPAFSEALVPAFEKQGFWLHGAFALNEGFILTSMILAAVAVAVIERRFREAALWALFAAALSAIGLMHSFKYTPADVVMNLGAPALEEGPWHWTRWQWVLGYTAMSGFFALAPYLTKPADGPGVPLTGEPTAGSSGQDKQSIPRPEQENQVRPSPLSPLWQRGS